MPEQSERIIRLCQAAGASDNEANVLSQLVALADRVKAKQAAKEAGK